MGLGEGEAAIRSPGREPRWPGQAGGSPDPAHPCKARAQSRAGGLGAKARLPPPSGSASPWALGPLSCCEQEEPTYFAIWGDNKAFNEVVISPAMLHEHLPYVVMEGLHKVSPLGGDTSSGPHNALLAQPPSPYCRQEFRRSEK